MRARRTWWLPHGGAAAAAVALALVLAGDGFGVDPAAAGPTRKGATRDESVYCQNWPGRSPYPQYRGTGPQTPCGPAFQRQPPPAPKPAPKPRRRDVCRVKATGLVPTAPHHLLVLASTGSGKLVIGKKAMHETKENYLCTIRYLTVAPTDQEKQVFKTGTDEAAIRKLEDPLRRQIFDAMNGTSGPAFRFADIAAAQENFAIRVAAVEFMNGIEEHCAYYGPGKPPRLASSYWETVDLAAGAAGHVFNSVPGASAHAAVLDLGSATAPGKSNVDCLTSVEITILWAVAKTIGQQRFDAIHPDGIHMLGLPKDSEAISVFRHLDYAKGSMTADAMVPGDWVYMRNKPDYRAYAKDGYWNGENALYMGRYHYDWWKQERTYDKAATPRFSGLGLKDQTEAEMREAMKKAYDAAVQWKTWWWIKDKPPQALDSDIKWTSIGRLEAGDAPGPSKPATKK